MASLQDEIAERNRKIEEVLEHPEALEAFHEFLDGFYREEFPSGEDHQVKLRWTMEGFLRIYFLLQRHDLVRLSGDETEEKHLDRLSGVLRRITLAVHGLIKGLHEGKNAILPYKVFDLDWQEGDLFQRRPFYHEGSLFTPASNDWTQQGHLLIQANLSDRHGFNYQQSRKPDMPKHLGRRPEDHFSVITIVRPTKYDSQGRLQARSAVYIADLAELRARGEQSERPPPSDQFKNTFMTGFVDRWTAATAHGLAPGVGPRRHLWQWHWGYERARIRNPQDMPEQLVVRPARLACASDPKPDGTIALDELFKFSPEAIQVAFQTSGFIVVSRELGSQAWNGTSRP